VDVAAGYPDAWTKAKESRHPLWGDAEKGEESPEGGSKACNYLNDGKKSNAWRDTGARIGRKAEIGKIPKIDGSGSGSLSK